MATLGGVLQSDVQPPPAPSAPRLRLQDYSDAVVEGWSDDEIYRAIIHEVPRLFHALGRNDQREALQAAPAPTGTHWDALLAATVEHVAALHDHPPPGWVSEPGRFLAAPWVACTLPAVRNECLAYAPAAFIRHGALPDPLDLDERGGEPHVWIPGP